MATKSMNGRNESAAAADLNDQIETLRQDIGALTQTISEMGKHKGDETIEAARAKASDLRDKAADHAETARLQALEMQDQANNFIRNQPATALGIAAGVGFLVGFFGSRK